MLLTRSTIAAEQTGRNAFLMELDLLYCDVIVTRFSNFVGPSAQIKLIRDSKEIPFVLAEAKGGCRRIGAFF
jgi:DNA modification methylase